MFDIEIIRIGFVLGLLAINTFTDLKSRTICGSDRQYVILAAIGLGLLLVDSIDGMLLPLLFVVINVTVILFMWRIKALASGDTLVCLVIAVTVPMLTDWGMMAFMMIMGAMFVSAVFALLYNSILNGFTLYRRETLFGEYGESALKKFFTFGLAHKKRSWEKHVISIEKGNGFSLTGSPFEKEFSVKNDQLVGVAIPFVPFVLFAFVLSLILSFL